jgi:putative CocE/NonD family hydrolase
VLVVGGWFDAEDQWGALNDYPSIKKKNPGVNDFLVMGPWYHGMWARPGGQTFGDLDFGMETSTFFEDKIEFPFFEKFLRDQPVPAPAAATVFETGRNVWHNEDIWPPQNLSGLRYFLNAQGGLSTKKPSAPGEVSYVYDPAAPTPYLADYKQSKRRTREYMIDDQRFAETRQDVATFKSEPITEDLTVAGSIDADIWLKTTGTDADVVVKVIDVWPDNSTVMSPFPKSVSMAGYEQLLKGDIFRGKFRKSFEKPEPFKPGEPTRVHFKLNDCYHTFLKGHRLMVQIQSAWFPLVDRNSNTFQDLYHAKNEDFHPATITLLLNPKHPSSIGFGQLR